MSKPKLLLIENDSDILDATKLFLSKHFDVDTSQTIDDAISKLASNEYEVAIIDMAFPDDDFEGGLRVCEYIFRNKLSTKSIVLTAYGDVQNFRKALRSGIFDYIEKGTSFTNDTLLAAALEASNSIEPAKSLRPEKQIGINKIFIAHGHNHSWRAIKDFIKYDLSYQVEFFENKNRTSEQIINQLKEFLNSCNVAVIHIEGDDLMDDGKKHPRLNVVHEMGFFQGRYGFDRVIIFQQEDVNLENLSNIQGLLKIKYKTDPQDGFQELRDALDKLAGK
ncbi:hypothetical protein GMMP15_660096 [Candidatus Magnetomoraceae bacterium gMMP-15]